MENNGDNLLGDKVGVQLVITLQPGGQMSVTGPIGNKMLCYGMLECARDVIAAQKSDGPRVQPARVLPRM
jgi:hypothetical protein